MLIAVLHETWNYRTQAISGIPVFIPELKNNL